MTLKQAVSWAGVIATYITGLYAFGRGGTLTMPYDYVGWFDVAGYGLFGASFILAAHLALRNRLRAVVVLFLTMPIAVFCHAYPSSGVYGSGLEAQYYFLPPLQVAVGLVIVFYAPLLAFLIGTKRYRLMAGVFVATALLAALILARSFWAPTLIPQVLRRTVVYLAFAMFWVETDRLNWPPLIRKVGASQRRVRRACVFAGSTAMAAFLVAVAVLCAASSQTGLPIGGCSGRYVVLGGEVRPDEMLFTARLLYVGGSRRARDQIRSQFATDAQVDGIGDWGIAWVDETLRGWPGWMPRLVLVRDAPYRAGDTYLFRSTRADGVLTRFLPVVDGFPCREPAPLGARVAELHILRERPIPNGAFVAGFVGEGPRSTWSPRSNSVPFAGAIVSASSGDKTFTTTTGADGVYEFRGLPPGDYTFKVEYRSRKFPEMGLIIEESRRDIPFVSIHDFQPN